MSLTRRGFALAFYLDSDSIVTNTTGLAKESGGNLAAVKSNTDSIVTNTNPLTASGARGYTRQDSTTTIAKESGRNLAGIKTDLDKFTFDRSGNLLVPLE